MTDREANRFSARAVRYAKVGANVGGVAARFAAQQLTGGRTSGRDASNAALLAKALGRGGRAVPNGRRIMVKARHYVLAGGGFPVTVKGAGVIGVIAVSGLPEREDHGIIVEVLATYLGLDAAALALPAQTSE